jgi:hypothetical protein
MHNGAFVRLEDAIRYHVDARRHGPACVADLLPPDLRARADPIAPVLERLDPLLREPVVLSDEELDALVDFVGNGLLGSGRACAPAAAVHSGKDPQRARDADIPVLERRQ